MQLSRALLLTSTRPAGFDIGVLIAGIVGRGGTTNKDAIAAILQPWLLPIAGIVFIVGVGRGFKQVQSPPMR